MYTHKFEIKFNGIDVEGNIEFDPIQGAMIKFTDSTIESREKEFNILVELLEVLCKTACKSSATFDKIIIEKLT